jgi:hypothetical protein
LKYYFQDHIKTQINKYLNELNKSREEYEKTTKILVEKVQEKYPDYSKHKIVKYIKTTLNDFNIKYNNSIDNLIKQDKFKTKAKCDMVGGGSRDDTGAVLANENCNSQDTNSQDQGFSPASKYANASTNKSNNNNNSSNNNNNNGNGKSNYGLNNSMNLNETQTRYNTSPKLNSNAYSSIPSPNSSTKHSNHSSDLKNSKKFKSNNNQSTSPSLSTKNEPKVEFIFNYTDD